jgi:superfamily II DNA/RNA helicase
LPFSDLPLSPDLLRALAGLGLSEPFPIQSAAIPPILAGRDLCARAATGSGKTLAFALPIVELLCRGGPRGGSSVSALVLVPTRELADQVGGVFGELARSLRRPFAVRVAHGGTSINPQMLALRGGADLLVATPGRLLDLAAKNAARLGSVRFLVLDEADKMLDLGFSEELAAVLALLPAGRQTLLFSATLSERLEDVAAAALRDPERISVDGACGAAPGGQGAAPSAAESAVLGATPGAMPGPEALPAGKIAELVYLVARDDKGPLLRRLIAEGPSDGRLVTAGASGAAGSGYGRVLVFASSNRRADNVSRKLNNNGIAAAPFHGDLSQGARTKALADFRAGKLRVLVASDLASRGLDIEGLPCVVNYELPRAPLDYVHRIGRTGRAGGSGLAISLVCPEEEAQLRLIEKRIGRRLEKRKESHPKD